MYQNAGKYCYFEMLLCLSFFPHRWGKAVENRQNPTKYDKHGEDLQTRAVTAFCCNKIAPDEIRCYSVQKPLSNVFKCLLAFPMVSPIAVIERTDITMVGFCLDDALI